jgi:hypothetical protein
MNQTASQTTATPLAQQIRSPAQLCDMTDDELSDLNVAHQNEIVEIQGRLDASANLEWARRATQALRVLRMHQQWVRQEIAHRRTLDGKKAKELAQSAHADFQRAIEAARLERIRLANIASERQNAAFKRVVKEAIGIEKYLALWELARASIEEPIDTDAKS